MRAERFWSRFWRLFPNFKNLECNYVQLDESERMVLKNKDTTWKDYMKMFSLTWKMALNFFVLEQYI